MIIDGTSIKGIFVYSTGISVEPGDFLLHNSNIYVVKDPRYDGSIPPDQSIYCNLYVKEVAATDDSIVTTGSLPAIVNNLVAGLGIDGSIKTIKFDSLAEFNKYTSTTVLNVIYSDTNYLFRCYRVVQQDGTEFILQERINYRIPTLEYRINTGTWSPWKMILTGGTSSANTALNTQLGALDLELNKIISSLNIVTRNNENMYCKRIYPDSNQVYWTTDDKDILLNVIIRYKENSQWYQSNVTIDPNAVNDDNKGILPSVSKSCKLLMIQSQIHAKDNLRGYSFTCSDPIEILVVLALNKY